MYLYLTIIPQPQPLPPTPPPQPPPPPPLHHHHYHHSSTTTSSTTSPPPPPLHHFLHYRHDQLHHHHHHHDYHHDTTTTNTTTPLPLPPPPLHNHHSSTTTSSTTPPLAPPLHCFLYHRHHQLHHDTTTTTPPPPPPPPLLPPLPLYHHHYYHYYTTTTAPTTSTTLPPSSPPLHHHCHSTTTIITTPPPLPRTTPPLPTLHHHSTTSTTITTSTTTTSPPPLFHHYHKYIVIRQVFEKDIGGRRRTMGLHNGGEERMLRGARGKDKERRELWDPQLIEIADDSVIAINGNQFRMGDLIPDFSQNLNLTEAHAGPVNGLFSERGLNCWSRAMVGLGCSSDKAQVELSGLRKMGNKPNNLGCFDGAGRMFWVESSRAGIEEVSLGFKDSTQLVDVHVANSSETGKARSENFRENLANLTQREGEREEEKATSNEADLATWGELGC
ncbi:hypothetical protein RHMOL_Rhmol09G0129100 [Rhododendron molle]|uniref:Uncharacterized protein n=1 Tax=Rhododendron molle TaxID=49168 RepID=A0ACC0MDW5_RHOML|nr:hypothetical protein RHMOL_Rhmol09G0129100 [Rhododendron molle]